MNFKTILNKQKMERTFEVIPVRQDLSSLLSEYETNYSAFEKKTFAVLGKDMGTDNKEAALRGKKAVTDKLNEIMDKRKSKTNVFRDIISVFTGQEKRFQDLIDRLQSYADQCLKLEKKQVDEANKAIAEAKEKVIETINQSDLPEAEKAVAVVQAAFTEAVELLDDTNSRKTCELKFTSRFGLLSLFNWYCYTQNFHDLDVNEYSSLTFSKIITQAKREHMKSGLTIPDIEFIINESAK
jgi:hypothetical protein